MKKLLASVLFIAVAFICHAQSDFDSSVVKKFHRIIGLMLNDSVATLASLIQYPLQRENPLPDISSPKEFIHYYNTLIDSSFKRELKQYDDSDVSEYHFAYGLTGGVFSGDLWLNEQGLISRINYSSKAEKELSQKITEDIRHKMHPSIKPWKRNVIVCKTDKYLVRIDLTDDGLRFISWDSGHSISEKPDLILYGGKEEARGSMGGWTYIFKNVEWTYVIDEVYLCAGDKPQDCGTFLRILNNGAEKSTYRCTEIK